MNSSIAAATSPLSHSSSPGIRRVCSKGPMEKSATAVHTRSPRSRYSLTYADWITRALMASKDKCACLSDIYEWMSFNVPGLQEQRFLHSSKGWKNAVRHTLSINPRFQKLKRLGKPALWTLSEEYLRQAQALTKISMSIAPRSDAGEGVQMINSNANMETCSSMADLPPSSSPQSKIFYAGKSNASPISSTHHTSDFLDPKVERDYGNRLPNLTHETIRNSILLADQLRNSTFLNTTTTAAPSGPTTSLIQACDAAAMASRAAFLSDLHALASLNALISANNETAMDTTDAMRQRFSAETAALAAAATTHGLGGGASQSNVASATPPLMNFFASTANNYPFSISRRGSGDSGISSISNASGSTSASSALSTNWDSIRPFTQALEVTTLSGLDATLVLPRPLPIQCLTDHKLLLASLIWPNPAVGYFNS